MRVLVSTDRTPPAPWRRTQLPYRLNCRLMMAPIDRDRARQVTAPAWQAFLAERRTTVDALVAGVSWTFATEVELATAAVALRAALRVLMQALGVDTLTPVEEYGADDTRSSVVSRAVLTAIRRRWT